jgi:hypothetical protein
MSRIENDLYYFRVVVDGEEWIVDGRSMKEALNKVMLEDPTADVEFIEKSEIAKIII